MNKRMKFSFPVTWHCSFPISFTPKAIYIRLLTTFNITHDKRQLTANKSHPANSKEIMTAGELYAFVISDNNRSDVYPETLC